MKLSKEKSEPLQAYRAWNNCGYSGYVLASSLDEARKLVLSQTCVSRFKAVIFNVEPIEDVLLTEIN